MRHGVIGVPVIVSDYLECPPAAGEGRDAKSIGIRPSSIGINKEGYPCLSLEEKGDVELLIARRHPKPVRYFGYGRIAQVDLVVGVHSPVAVDILVFDISRLGNAPQFLNG